MISLVFPNINFFKKYIFFQIRDTPDTIPSAEGVDLRADRCFSLVFKDGVRDPLDLAAEDSGQRDMWVDALSHLVVTIRSLGQQQEYEM